MTAAIRTSPTARVGRFPPALLLQERNLAAFVQAHAVLDPQRPALIFTQATSDDVVVTFGALVARGHQIAAELRRSGVRPGTRVLVAVPMGPAFYAVLFGVMAAGACAVVVDPSMSRAHLRAALKAARVDAVVGSARAHLLRLLPELQRARPFVVGPVPVWARPLCGAAVDGEDDVAALPQLTPVEINEDALVTFTTGSTGTPKGARRSHTALNMQGAVLDGAWPRIAGDVDLATLPVFATLNLSQGIATVFPPFDLSRVDIDDATAALTLQTMARLGVTTCGGSPAFVDALARAATRDHIVLPRLRALALGGAPVSVAVAARVRAAFPACAVRVVYGATEAEPIATVDIDDVIAAAAAAATGMGCLVGAPHPATRVHLAPLSDSPDVGEVCVAGPHVLRDYVDADATARARLTVGDTTFLRTGDAARMDSAGRLWLVGRVSERVLDAQGRVLFPLCVEGVARARGVRAALVQVSGRAVLAVADGDPTCVRDLADAVVCVDSLPTDPRHRARIDRRGLARVLEEKL